MRAPGTVCHTIQSMHAPHTIDMYSKGAIVDAGARRNASVMRCWPAQPESPSSAIQVQSRASMATQPRAASAPAPRAVSSRNQNTIEAVVSVAAITRSITTTMAQHSAAASAASPARLTKPEAVGFRITSTPDEAGENRGPDVPVRLLPQEQRGKGHDEQRRAQGDRVGVRQAHAGERPHEAPEHQDRQHRAGEMHRDAARAQLGQAPGDAHSSGTRRAGSLRRAGTRSASGGSSPRGASSARPSPRRRRPRRS